MALIAFAAVMMLLPSVTMLAAAYCFTPAVAVAGWRLDPLGVALSPLASQFAQAGLFAAAFDAILLLAAGRHVERALGPVSLVALFVAGAYGGALARLVLTPGSIVPGLNANGALFAEVGAYLMLYGIPRGLPASLGRSRLGQVAGLAALWALVQLAFMVAAGGDLST
uniref:rhomboid family intramembrane serine protease n=1 Tax=Sphingomonas bacterium TaxID=1895847 RepID=UPI001575993A